MKDKEVPERIWINPVAFVSTMHRRQARVEIEKTFDDDVPYILASQVAAEIAERDAEFGRLKKELSIVKADAREMAERLTMAADRCGVLLVENGSLRANHAAEIEKVRSDALEDAAKVCDEHQFARASYIVDLIRALIPDNEAEKGKQSED